MKRLSNRTYLMLAVVLLLMLGGFHLAFKKPLDEEQINKMKEQFAFQDRYLYEYAPDFEVQRLDGSSFKLSDELGDNVVVLNFFTTWCQPCLEEMPELERFVAAMSDKPVVFLAINVGEEPGTVSSFLKEEDIDLPVAVDSEKQVGGKYRLESFPTTVVINPRGRIEMYQEGAIANAEVSLVPVIQPLLQELEQEQTTFSLETYFQNVKTRLPPRVIQDAPENESAQQELQPPSESTGED